MVNMYMRGDSQHLFSEEGLDRLEDSLKQKMLDEVDRMDEERILRTSMTDLCDYFEGQYLIEIPQFKEEEVKIQYKETKIDARRMLDYRLLGLDQGRPIFRTVTVVTFYVPCNGDVGLLKFRPSTFNFGPPMATIRDGELELTFIGDNIDATTVKSEFNEEMQKIKAQLVILNKDLTNYNNAMKGQVKSALESRKQRILKNRGLVAELGFPLKHNNTSPQTYIAPVNRKKLVVSMPPPSPAPFVPEPVLDMSEYEHILSIVQSMSIVMERSPMAFREMGEEDLRWLFLVPLNGHYEGQATGETFNFKGKTDILIRAKDKNIFVAECKKWGGPKLMAETIDQILGYTSWRDTKIAILVFNRNEDFSAVLKKINEVASTHKNCKKPLPYNSETGFRYLYHYPGDTNRELTMTIMAFNVPK